MNHLDTLLSALHIQNFLAASRQYFALGNDRGSATPHAAVSANRTEPDKLAMNAYRKVAQSFLLAAGLGAFAAAPAMADADCGRMGDAHEHHAKMREQHHQRLHDALKLSPEQEPAWTKLMASEQPKPAVSQPEDGSRLKAPERAEKMLEISRARQEQMAAHVAALKAFYATLTPEQQQIFEDHHAAPRRGMRSSPAPKTPDASKTGGKP